MTTHSTTNELHVEASTWAVRLMDSDVTSAERAEFQQWLLADEVNETLFREYAVLLNLGLDIPKATHPELIVPTEAEQTSRRPMWLSAMAASLALMLGLSVWFVQRNDSGSNTHITTATEPRDATLPDGSVAHLNVRTDLQWIGRSGERRVALLEGEALFEVTHDATKPFTVVLDTSEIRVLGTRFNVRRRDNAEVVVTVLDGTVQVATSSNQKPVWTRTLHANEQLVYNNDGIARDIYASVNAAKWREGILQFADEPLSTIVGDLSRYTDRRIHIDDPRVARLRLGGQLVVRNELMTSLRILEKLAPIVVHERGDALVIDYRRDETGSGADGNAAL